MLWYVFGIVAAILIAILVIDMIRLQKCFEVNSVTLHVQPNSKTFQSPKSLVFLSDFHNHCYGNDNDELICAILACHPDYIVIAGDMIVRKAKNNDRSVGLLNRLYQSGIPVMYSLGNHESRLREEFPERYRDYMQKIENPLLTVLDNRTVSPEEGLYFAGLTLPKDCFRKGFGTGKVSKEQIEEMIGTRPDGVTVLLAHNPNQFEAYDRYGADITLSGHVHGGIVRLPKLGGVISPEWKPFPKYDSGLFQGTRTKMLISKGLGMHTIPVRLWNKAELIHITVMTEQSEQNL